MKDLGLDELLYELKVGLKNIFDKKLKEIIVYGSYARGESDEGSDLDIMVLVNMDEREIDKKRDEVLDVVVDLTTRYGVVLSIIENNYDYFYDWARALPFFTNIIREGVNIYG
jgi:predicted nucleotidyltransferase